MTLLESQTFKTRVHNFWQWFAANQERIYETIDTGNAPSLAEEISEVVGRMIPGLAWCFGPGENDGHAMTFSGEGFLPKQLLAAFWQQQAPEFPGWTFFASTQPTNPQNLKSLEIKVGPNEAVDVSGMIVSTVADEEAEKFDLTAWHPMLEKVPSENHMQIIFLLLDEALGEFGTSQWLRKIAVGQPPEGSRAMSLIDLPDFLKQAHRYHGWQKLDPLASYSAFTADGSHDGPRGDMIAGSTMIPYVVLEYVDADGKLDEPPLNETGAYIAYLQFDSSSLASGQEASARANIEDALEAALIRSNSGRCVGGAYGINKSYIDLILFDGTNSESIVNETIKNLSLKNPKIIRIG